MTENGVVSSGATPALAGLLEVEGVEDSKVEGDRSSSPLPPSNQSPAPSFAHNCHATRTSPGWTAPCGSWRAATIDVLPDAQDVLPVAHDPCLSLSRPHPATQASSGLVLDYCVPVHLQAFSVRTKEIDTSESLVQSVLTYCVVCTGHQPSLLGVGNISGTVP